MDQLETKMTTTFSDSTAFTTEMQKTMEAHDVKSVSPASITADTTATPKSAGNVGSADGDVANKTGDDSVGSSTLIIVIVILVVCVVVLLGAVVWYRGRSTSASDPGKETYEASRRPTVGVFEGDGGTSYINPMDTASIELSTLAVGNAFTSISQHTSTSTDLPSTGPSPEVHIDPTSGRSYTFDRATGRSSWL